MKEDMAKRDAQETFTAKQGKTVNRKNLSKVSDEIRKEEMS